MREKYLENNPACHIISVVTSSNIGGKNRTKNKQDLFISHPGNILLPGSFCRVSTNALKEYLTAYTVCIITSTVKQEMYKNKGRTLVCKKFNSQLT